MAWECGALVSRLEKNKGKGWALRHGIKQAKGDIIGFLDGDVEESSIEIQIINRLLMGIVMLQ